MLFVYVCVVVFFFFKQKTAYEMRISDWSSDVCSSDLPALSIRPQSTLGAFDSAHPEGADYVIVPAFHHDDREGPILDWLRKQAVSRATIIGICEGVKVVGRAGLLDGRRATTHWYAIGALQRAYPTMQ